MTLLKPYSTINENKRNPYSLTYTGIVVDNRDPDKLKRLKVNIDLWDYLTDDDLQWVAPEGRGGNSPNCDEQDIPEIGSEVKVYFNNNDPNDPRYTGAEVTEANKCSLYDEDYPNTTGKKDSIGNFTMHNKRTGISVFHHNSGTEIQCDPDGSYTITGKSGCIARCDADGHYTFKGTSMKIVCDEEINLQATRIKLTAKNGVDINGGQVDIKGEMGVDLTSPNLNFAGTKAVFNTNSVVVNNMFQLMKGGSYTLLDPFSKCTVTIQDGVVTGVEFW